MSSVPASSKEVSRFSHHQLVLPHLNANSSAKSWNIPVFIGSNEGAALSVKVSAKVKTETSNNSYRRITLNLKLRETGKQNVENETLYAKFESISVTDASNIVHDLSLVDGNIPNLQGNCTIAHRCYISKPMDIYKTNTTATMIFLTNYLSRFLNDNALHATFKITYSDHKISKSGKGSTQEPDFELCSFQAVSDYEAMLNDEATADVILRATLGSGKDFHCHKSFLVARSAVFRAMLGAQMRESTEGLIVIDDISPDALEHFISFLYCGRFQNESWIQHLPSFVYASDKYGIQSLKALCDTHLIKSVTCENALAAAALAQRHQLKQAVQDIRVFISKNANQINLDPSSLLA